MAKYREVRDIILEVLNDKGWHTTDELQKECETKGIVFESGRGPIYNIVHQLKKKGKVETDGNGAYRICDKNPNSEEKKDFNQAYFRERNTDLIENIKSIEKHLEKYRKFNWINCSEKELQEARFCASKLIKLSEKIKSELGGQV